jgi:TolB-like protein
LSLIKELKRRNVFKVGIAYAVTTWILWQLSIVVTGILSLPDWAPQLILLILLVGFLPAIILAWAFELTPDGVKLQKDVPAEASIAKKTGRKLDYIIIVSLGLSLGYFIWESRFEQKTAEYEAATAAALAAGPVVEVPAPAPAPVAITPREDIDKNSIAVLPFANRSADAEDIYFTDGIHDDLLTQLSRIDAFSVISRSSVMEYRNTTKNLRQIAQELSVANVMEGSVQRAGDRVRINVQLIDAFTDEHLWAEIYDRALTTGNLFDIQSEIAQAIATALKATLTDTELATVAEVPTENVQAYDLYLQARRFKKSGTRNGIQTAIGLYKKALLLDPGFKLGWIGLADAHMNNYWAHGGDPAHRDSALETIERARSIDDSFAELYMAEGFYWYWGHLDYERALYHLEKAIEMMPGNEEAYMWKAYASRRAGSWEQALESMQRSLKLSPRQSVNWYEYATTASYLHQYEKAESAATTALEVDPNNFWGKIALANVVLQASGDTETAVQLTTGAQNNGEYDSFEAYMTARLFARRFDEVLEVVRELPAELETQRKLITLREDWSAQILYFMGRDEEAKLAANAALFRLKGMGAESGEDYRLDLAEARVSAIQGADADSIRKLVEESKRSIPEDAMEAPTFALEYARIFAIAGLVTESIELLEPLLTPPSQTSVFTIDLDPAFDRIRESPEFAAMMQHHR